MDFLNGSYTTAGVIISEDEHTAHTGSRIWRDPNAIDRVRLLQLSDTLSSQRACSFLKCFLMLCFFTTLPTLFSSLWSRHCPSLAHHHADREPQRDQPIHVPPAIDVPSSSGGAAAAAGVPRVPDIDHEPIHIPASSRAPKNGPQRAQPRALQPSPSPRPHTSDFVQHRAPVPSQNSLISNLPPQRPQHAPRPSPRSHAPSLAQHRQSSPAIDTGVFTGASAAQHVPLQSQKPAPRPDDQSASPIGDPFASLSNIFPQNDDPPSVLAPAPSQHPAPAPAPRQHPALALVPSPRLHPAPAPALVPAPMQQARYRPPGAPAGAVSFTPIGISSIYNVSSNDTYVHVPASQLGLALWQYMWVSSGHKLLNKQLQFSILLPYAVFVGFSRNEPFISVDSGCFPSPLKPQHPYHGGLISSCL